MMSSDYTISVLSLEPARLQGAQQPTQVPKSRKPEQPERNEPAARGQDLPSTRLEEAEERTQVEQVESAVSRISDFVQNFQRDLLFSIDEESDRLVVKVVDSETQEVIRQIPSEETLRIAKNLDSPESLILREQA
ncbi:MAG: flagellar protein FlaG [Thiogranum sp.]